MEPMPTNVERLANAGLLTSVDGLSDEYVSAINQLSRSEVNSLIAVKQDLSLKGTMNSGVQPSSY